MKRLLRIAVPLTVLVVGWLFISMTRDPGPQVVVGVIDDFAVGTMTPLAVRARVTQPDAGLAAASQRRVGGAPVLIVNDEDEGLLALDAVDPHSNCRVIPASDYSAEGQTLDPEVAIVDPCHGAKYDLTGHYLAGPSPRGLDRFGITIEGHDVIVDFEAFEYGPAR
jgi:nitrite reductase/ring-hydroxylating ferredoxin subunit